MDTTNALIFEGFDLVGKTTYAKSLINNLYRPDYSVVDKYYSRNIAFMYGYAQADLFVYMKDNDLVIPEKIGIDRSVMSGYVYSRLYPDKFLEPVPPDIVVSYYMKMTYAFDQVDIYNVYHKDIVSARAIYDYNKNHETDHIESFDIFDDFDQYFSYFLASVDYFDYTIDIIKSRLSRSVMDESLIIHNVISYVDQGELKFKDDKMQFREVSE